MGDSLAFYGARPEKGGIAEARVDISNKSSILP